MNQPNQNANFYSQYNQKLAVRRKNLPSLLDISPSTLDGMLNPKSPYFVADFPKPKRLGKRSVVWCLEDLMAYLRAKDGDSITEKEGQQPN